jgi:hypothetical protein
VVVLPGAAAGDLCRSAIDALDPLFRRTAAPRLTNAAWGLEPLRRLASLPEVVDLLTFLYGRRPVPFQTLDFCTGTHQELHSDEFHFDSLPPRFMCGVWIALEPIGPDQGPLVYTPRHSAGAASTAKPLPFTADTGDALVWSSSVVHGGAPILDPTSSRWSHVTHYFFEGCVWYTPCRSDLGRGEMEVRMPLVDLATGRPVMPRLDGRPPQVRSPRAPPGGADPPPEAAAVVVRPNAVATCTVGNQPNRAGVVVEVEQAHPAPAWGRASRAPRQPGC